MELAASALDLCVRNKRPPTPPEDQTTLLDYSFMSSRTESPSTCQYSPVSNHSDSDNSLTSSGDAKIFSCKPKASRPFKAYPKDLRLAVPGTCGPLPSDPAFEQFRQRVLSQVQNTGGTNRNMRRVPQHLQSKVAEDPTYWEKRRKNNEAAKRSRDARRAKEDEIAIRCAFLEQENLQLKYRVATMQV